MHRIESPCPVIERCAARRRSPYRERYRPGRNKPFVAGTGICLEDAEPVPSGGRADARHADRESSSRSLAVGSTTEWPIVARVRPQSSGVRFAACQINTA